MRTPTLPGRPVAGNAAGPLEQRFATCDQEAWVQDRIRTAIRMATSLHLEKQVSADEPIERYGLAGIIEGAAREIIETLGMKPEFVNIRKIDNE